MATLILISLFILYFKSLVIYHFILCSTFTAHSNRHLDQSFAHSLIFGIVIHLSFISLIFIFYFNFEFGVNLL
jgi:hypothetical protein